jgi:hypothetical protein
MINKMIDKSVKIQRKKIPEIIYLYLELHSAQKILVEGRHELDLSCESFKNIINNIREVLSPSRPKNEIF